MRHHSQTGGWDKGDQIPVLTIECLKLTVFCLKLYEQTNQDIPDMTTLSLDDILSIRDQKRDEDEYLSSKEPRPELKPMSIDVHSAPTCFDKARVIFGNTRGSTGIPLTYVIRLNIEAKPEKGDPRFGSTNSPYGSFNE